ncbi:serine hydrolase [Oenococcus sp.]|uniref:serine hydrolase n=2 Tax=Oenococcus sp. TaxID=1979414 RepID=UPI0039ED26C5
MAMNFSQISQEIEDILEGVSPTTNFSFYLAFEDKQFTYHANRTLPSASLIKLMIADFYMTHYSEQELTEQTTKLDSLIFGAGIMSILQADNFSLADLITMMLSLSDNRAANTLIEFAGLAPLRDWISSRYPKTILARKFMDFKNSEDNLTNVYDLATALTALMHYPLTKRALLNQQSLDKFEISFAESSDQRAKFYNKSGEDDGIDHDAILFEKGNQTATMILMTQYDSQQQSRLSIINLFSELGSLVWASLK